MIKKLYFLLTLLFIFSLPVSAQKPGRGWNTRPFDQVQVTRTLKQRVVTSGYRAWKAQETNLYAKRVFHSIRAPQSDRPISSPLYADPAVLYPQVPFLKTQEQLTDYFLSKKNRDIARWMPKLEKIQQQIMDHLPDFAAYKTPVYHSPDQDIAWLAQQIPADTRYLLLGEVHDVPEIALNVTKLLVQLRKQYPEREILLFTEFLPEKALWRVTTHTTRLSSYILAWDVIQSAHIPVLGLEPDFVENNLHTATDQISAQDPGKNIWGSFEGLRLRNTRWLEFITQAREQYPDALFVIYSGIAHVMYGYPYSLADTLQTDHPFVVTFYPNVKRISEDQWTDQTSFFDRFTFGSFASERVLQFNHRTLSKLAGFDVQLKVPLLEE